MSNFVSKSDATQFSLDVAQIWLNPSATSIINVCKQASLDLIARCYCLPYNSWSHNLLISTVIPRSSPSIGTALSNQDWTRMHIRRRIMYKTAAFCSPEMCKKNSSLPRVVSTIEIDISGFPKYSVNGSNNVYLFS